jgi:hypothetical protein
VASCSCTPAVRTRLARPSSLSATSLPGIRWTRVFTVSRWHPAEEEWEDAGAPLPETAGRRHAEHERPIAEETRDSLACGYALWEVRVDMPAHREAVELAARLEAEGYQVIRRWKFLALGADNEDAANDLAKAVQRDAPADAIVQTEAGVFVNGTVPLFPH